MSPAPARWIAPLTLEGPVARLEPLAAEHADGLRAAVRDGELWKLWYTVIPPPEQIDAYVAANLANPRDPDAQAFVVRERASGRIVGCTRFMNVEPEHRRLEIGGTWYARSVQRTGVNTDCKRLLLTHAFEQLCALAVEFRTHWMNQASRAAILRLGAKQDGVLRQHRLMPDGSRRDTVVFSIVDSEWPAVKLHLNALAARTR